MIVRVKEGANPSGVLVVSLQSTSQMFLRSLIDCLSLKAHLYWQNLMSKMAAISQCINATPTYLGLLGQHDTK
jgi:hypothetical protein